MLVEEIIHRDVRKPPKFSVQDMVGRGWDMMVLAHKQHPGTVIKINKGRLSEPIENNAIYKFTDLAMEHAPTNPYFPRIYKAHVLDNKRRNFKHLMVVMEKLHDIRDNKQLEDVFEFHKERMGIQNYRPEDWKQMQKDFNNPAKRNEILSNATDDKFVEAMKLLEGIKEDNSFAFDFHFGNLMFRLTGHGPQVVLIDPFAPMNSSLGRE